MKINANEFKVPIWADHYLILAALFGLIASSHSLQATQSPHSFQYPPPIQSTHLIQLIELRVTSQII